MKEDFWLYTITAESKSEKKLKSVNICEVIGKNQVSCFFDTRGNVFTVYNKLQYSFRGIKYCSEYHACTFSEATRYSTLKLKETVEECMREFNVSTVNDVIDARKRKFFAKYTAYLKTHYAKCLHVWVGLIYDNCAHYVTHLHYTVRYLLLS